MWWIWDTRNLSPGHRTTVIAIKSVHGLPFKYRLIGKSTVLMMGKYKYKDNDWKVQGP